MFLNIYSKPLELHLIDSVQFLFLVIFEKPVGFASCNKQNNEIHNFQTHYKKNKLTIT